MAKRTCPKLLASENEKVLDGIAARPHKKSMADTMKAIVVHRPGGPEVLRLETIPIPQPQLGWVRIRIRAFGLNRAELFTRAGDSGAAVKFPRVIGIECVGEVDLDPSGEIRSGQKVAAMMGGMGRAFDGSYAEFTVVPRASVLQIQTELDWPDFAALPEMFQTASGSLQALRVTEDKTILIRGGTSSVGMAAAALARNLGLHVIATTRRAEREYALKDNGADQVLIDSGGPLNRSLRAIKEDGVDYVLDLVGTKTLDDSLAMLAPGGTCCMTGILAGSWFLNEWNPMERIRPGTYLTAYSGEGMPEAELQKIVTAVEAGRISVKTDRVFGLKELALAHQYMESNQALGKCVVNLS